MSHHIIQAQIQYSSTYSASTVVSLAGLVVAGFEAELFVPGGNRRFPTTRLPQWHTQSQSSATTRPRVGRALSCELLMLVAHRRSQMRLYGGTSRRMRALRLDMTCASGVGESLYSKPFPLGCITCREHVDVAKSSL